MKLHAFLWVLFFSGAFAMSNAVAQTIKISLYNDLNVQEVLIEPTSGQYEWVSGDKVVYKMDNRRPVIIQQYEGQIRLRSLQREEGIYNELHLRPTNPSLIASLVSRKRDKSDNLFRIKASTPDLPERIYEDSLSIYSKDGALFFLYATDLEAYLPGVVEAETGPNALYEFYKSQAVICRTYAVRNTKRHQREGFLMCDNVHCQVYRGVSLKNPEITQAVHDTHGQVIVDVDDYPIDAVFSANCGGETVNSKDIWRWPAPYLQSVSDSFCVHSRSASWTDTIATVDWLNYLAKKMSEDVHNTSPFDFSQPERELFYKLSLFVSLQDIRTDWKLRSAFFDMRAEGDSLVFYGRGYGHGVGMCQDGAIRMAEFGYMYNQIIQFYYTDVRIKNLSALRKIKFPE